MGPRHSIRHNDVDVSLDLRVQFNGVIISQPQPLHPHILQARFSLLSFDLYILSLPSESQKTDQNEQGTAPRLLYAKSNAALSPAYVLILIADGILDIADKATTQQVRDAYKRYAPSPTCAKVT